MKILIVDDSKLMRSIVIRTLRHAGFGGHTFEEAQDGIAALDLIKRAAPDLVLTDWNMPRMPGIDLLRRVRATGQEMPFVFITSEGTDEIHDMAFRAGARAVLTKPFTPEMFRLNLTGIIE